jgi:hypothetical protein
MQHTAEIANLEERSNQEIINPRIVKHEQGVDKSKHSLLDPE